MRYLLILLITILFSCRKTDLDGHNIMSSTRNISQSSEILVQFKSGAPVAAGFKRRVHTAAMKRSGDAGFYVYQVTNVNEAVETYKANGNVRWVAPNYTVATNYPNDPYYVSGQLWGIDRINAPIAWQTNTGSSNVYVAVIDEGIQTSHEDLSSNIWVNPFDGPDGVDNDGNGYIDDSNGWDFMHEDNSVYDGVDNHGTHVAGTIGAVGNNGVGVIGVSPNITMISAKFLEGSGTIEDAIQAVDYVTDLRTRHNLNIVATNNSWSGGGFVQGLYDAINRAKTAGILFVAAAGNNSWDNDINLAYPASYDLDNIISVAATNSTDELAYFSNWGLLTVDLAAPGEGIWSSLPINNYGNYSGTSMASPHVAGAVALYAAANAGATYLQIKTAILSTVTPLASLLGKTVTGGLLNVAFGSTVPPEIVYTEEFETI